MSKLNTLELLNQVDPSQLNYQEWCNVGLALHHEGYEASDWDAWSQRDAERYEPNECYKKWESFGSGGGTVTAGTIFQYATNQGWSPWGNTPAKALGWDATITDDYSIVDPNWVEGQAFEAPSNYNPKNEMKRYLETLFKPDEHVSYVLDAIADDKGKYKPARAGSMSRTSGQLIDLLNEKTSTFESVMGTPNPEAGAWIRFNPIDGAGAKDENVIDYRYALVESDDMDLEKQNAIIRELELPVALLMYSGGKSIHAIVKINATTMAEYRTRVDYLYKICGNNGLIIDTQNRNASRLSRMPGVSRGDNKQFIIDTNIGKPTWESWEEYIEELNDDLPDIQNLGDMWDKMPPLPEEIISGVLRKGHKMMLAGPSKAGKSFALIQLAIAVAEGTKWFGWDVKKGRVLYINLELGDASGWDRLKRGYKALQIEPKNVNDLEVWNLRGHSAPMDKLVPKLIRRAKKQNYDMVIVDPIYKVLTGDENSAEAMAYFTNQFDKIAHELGASVIYCHHHSKGAQGGKNSMDRSSGSGVFARDPDAILDLVQLEVTEATTEHELNEKTAQLYCTELNRLHPKYYEEKVSQDDEFSAHQMREHLVAICTVKERNLIDELREEIEYKIASKTAWRVEGSLREFAAFKPVNMWFEHPIHVVDTLDVMTDLSIEGEQKSWGGNKQRSNKKTKKDRSKERNEALNLAFSDLAFNGQDVKVTDLSEAMGVTEKTVRRHIKEHGGLWIDEGVVGVKS